jgi:hypothetical protein
VNYITFVLLLASLTSRIFIEKWAFDMDKSAVELE